MDPTADLLQRLLVWGLLPVWTLAGLADAWAHRVQRIEHSAGWPESALHLVMLAELGTAVLLAALCDVNAAVLLCLLVLCLTHDVTMAVDLVWADRRRRIPPVEQWIHGVQQAMPWAACLLLAVVHVAQAGGAAAAVTAPGAWTFALRRSPLPPAAWGVIGSAALLLCAAFVGEAARAWRVRRR